MKIPQNMRFNAHNWLKNHCPQQVIAGQIAKSLIFIIVVLSFCFPKVGFLPMGSEGFDLRNNLLFPFSHANIFHLACNMLCLYYLRPPLHLLPAFLISFLSSLLPEFSFSSSLTPIMGFSGILFAIVGIKYGQRSLWSQMWRSTWLFFVITLFIPNVACLFHVYCMVIGYAYGWLNTTYRLWKKTRICL